MKTLLCGAVLMLAAFSGRAQAVRYATQGHLPIESQPALGYERPEYLGVGDQVQLLPNPPTDNPHHISAAMRGYFVYVAYPAYRGQPAGQGWVLRRGLVSTADSLLLDIPPMPAQTITTTKVVTTKRYVPATSKATPHPAAPTSKTPPKRSQP